MTPARRPVSLRRFLLLGILLPVGLFVVVNAVSLYRDTLSAVNTAYDRTLLASSKSIGELLEVEGFDEALILETRDRTTEHLSGEIHRQLGFLWNAREIEGNFDVCRRRLAGDRLH